MPDGTATLPVASLDTTLPETASPDRTPAAWRRLRRQAAEVAAREPVLGAQMRRAVLDRSDFADALAALLAAKLATADVTSDALHGLLSALFAEEPVTVATAATDLAASVDRNPAFPDELTGLLYAKGFHALQTYRAAHVLWRRGRRELAVWLSAQANEVFAVDIHPAARIGAGVFIDHGTGVVIGETATVGHDSSMLHLVTLGGTGKDSGDRHPKVGRGVLIGAGATILGNVQVGDGARIGAGSVVLDRVPPRSTAVGVPAQVVRAHGDPAPALSMSHVVPDGLDWSV
jgi:serine O-acetyltransferase